MELAVLHIGIACGCPAGTVTKGGTHRFGGAQFGGALVAPALKGGGSSGSGGGGMYVPAASATAAAANLAFSVSKRASHIWLRSATPSGMSRFFGRSGCCSLQNM